MICESGDFQQGVDGREKGNEEDRKPGQELYGGKSAGWRKAQSAEDQIPDHVDHSRCDNLVEGILDKATEPAPEEPLHFWNDKEWNKDRAHQHADGGGDEAVGDDDECDGLGRRKQNDHDHINRSAEEISPTRRIHTRLKVRDLPDDVLQLRLVDPARQKLCFVGDEVVEAGSYAGNRRAVVVDHGEAKTDGEEETREVVELKGLLAACGGQSRLYAVPDDEDGCEHTKKVLAHGVEEAEVLREQVVDRLKDVLQEVSLHRIGSFDLGLRCPHAHGVRKFSSESVIVPVTWLIFPARLACREISALMELVVASRCCLAMMVCCSR